MAQTAARGDGLGAFRMWLVKAAQRAAQPLILGKFQCRGDLGEQNLPRLGSGQIGGVVGLARRQHGPGIARNPCRIQQLCRVGKILRRGADQGAGVGGQGGFRVQKPLQPGQPARRDRLFGKPFGRQQGRITRQQPHLRLGPRSLGVRPKGDGQAKAVLFHRTKAQVLHPKPRIIGGVEGGFDGFGCAVLRGGVG